jgi:ABC-2 type transport system ATP-binding protein
VDAITTHGLAKAYPSQIGKGKYQALADLSLSVGENEVFGFLGRNGAGKTTTIKILCSLLRATEGNARIFGERAGTRNARKLIGYLPENPYFYEYLTPRETVDFYGRLHGLKAHERQAQWTSLKDRLELGSLADRRIRGFSKGQRQRLGFAVALVGNPQVLILDEPMSGLDPIGRRTIRELILRLRDEKKTLFFSSHVLGDVEQICDEVGILVNGRLKTKGRIDQLLTQRVERVEIIAEGLAHEVANQLQRQTQEHRESEAGHHFVVGDLSAANAIVQAIHEAGGALVEFTPMKESLEDYFMREQEGQS